MSFLSNIFGKSKKNLPDSLSPGTPDEKPSPEPARGGTTLRKQEDAPPQHEHKAGPELSALEMAERQKWEVKTLPVWKPGDEILGLYRVEDVLEGGMGRVYIVHHKGWNVNLAIKSPNEMMLSDRSNFARVLREANSWVELGLHPNIAYCYYVRSIEEVPHIFVEYVDGGNLRQWIEDGKCIDYRLTLDLAIQFCHGMEYAHLKGMIHRDIKPENVLINKEGTLKITDFGLVRTGAAISDSKGKAEVLAKGMTRIGDVMGTEGFMPPEQFTDAAGVDERADIFSFGVCLYEMCCGARPYDITIGERRDAPDPIGLSRDKKFPPALSEVLTKCVQWERDKRYGTFKEIRERLNTICRELFHQESPYADLELVDLEADSLNNRGVSYFELGRREDAISCWEQAITLNNLHIEATYNLNLILWRNSKIDDLEVLKRLENCANNPTIKIQILAEMKALIHAERKDTIAARNILREFPGRYEALFCGKGFEQSGSVLNLEGLTSSVSTIALSADGRYALSGSYGTVLVWELDGGQKIRTLKGHMNWVNSVAVTPDSRYAISGSSDNTLKLWELESGQCACTLKGHTQPVLSVAFSPNGRYAISGSEDNTLRVWELESGHCIRILEGFATSYKELVLSLDGRYVMSGLKTLRVWELESGRCVKILEGHTDIISSVAFTPDGCNVVSGSWDKSLRVWDLESGRCIRTLKGHTHQIFSVALTPNGQYAISGGGDSTLRVWQLESGQCIRTLEGHINRYDYWVKSVAVTPDGMYMVSLSKDIRYSKWAPESPPYTLKVWELESGRCIRTFEGHPNCVISFAFILDGLYTVADCKDKTLRLRKFIADIAYTADLRVSKVKGFKKRIKDKAYFDEEINKTKYLYEKGEYNNSFSVLYSIWKNNKFSVNDSMLGLYYSLMQKGRIRGLKFSFQKRLLKGHTNRVSSVAITSDSRYAISGSMDNTLKLWKLESGRCIHTFKGHTKPVSSVAITPGGKYVVSGSYDMTLGIWDLLTGKCVRRLNTNPVEPHSVVLSFDGRQAVIGSNLEQLWVVEFANNRRIHTLKGHTRPVNSVAIASDNQYAISGSSDSSLMVWELESGRWVRTLKGHKADITSVAFTPDNQYAVSCSWDSTIRVWELASGQCACTLNGHRRSVQSVAIAPNSRYAISGSGDNTLKLWELFSGRCLRTLEGHTEDVYSVAFTPDGCNAISGSDDNTLRVWELFWDLEFPDPVDWDEGVRPYLDIFLTLHKGKWGKEDFKLLIDELASKRGYGWVRPEGIRKELEKMTKEYEPAQGLA